MFERPQFIGGYGRLPSLMLGMALSAIPGIRQVAMHAGLVDPLFAYIGMATFAAVGRAALPGRVTPGALSLEIGV